MTNKVKIQERVCTNLTKLGKKYLSQLSKVLISKEPKLYK